MLNLNRMRSRRHRVCFFFNAQLHQLLHGISTAVELARHHPVEVHVLAPGDEHISCARTLTERLGGAPINFSVVGGRMLHTIKRLTGGRSIPPKLLTLAAVAPRLSHFDAIALPERTSIILKRLGLRWPRYIHIDHGAGDRAAGFDPRIRLFDFVMMAGEKHRERLEREGLIRPGAFAVVGYPKFDAADAVRDPCWTPFADDKPIVLYNPHFSSLGSWERFGLEVICRFATQTRYNLLFAPHVRLFDRKSSRSAVLAALADYRGKPNIHIDLGSERSVDMTYTSLADVYLGDVSSQVYEFLRAPRPCLFLDAHGIDWAADENYAHWRFGPVLRSVDNLIAEVDAACASHGAYAGIQREGFATTFSLTEISSSRRAADAIADYLARTLGD